ncbi:MAG TPA: hypothetical protein VFA94_16915 [Acidimicrobiales bacterium]|nr:hypothetical protein [Acidimicrobiales bacterium]
MTGGGIDRRAIFFVIAAAVCFALVPVAQEEFRPLAITVGVVYVVLAVLSALDAWSRSRP